MDETHYGSKTNRYDVIRIRDDYFEVASQTTHRKYHVYMKDKRKFYCNCPQNMYRNQHCKHIKIIEHMIDFHEKQRTINKTIINPITETQCPSCHSTDIRKYGKRKNVYGTIQRFICTECARTFCNNIGFEKMKTSPNSITMALQMYYSGQSVRNTAKSLKILGVRVNHSTVYRWLKKYVKKMADYLDKIIPNVGDLWRADELYLKIKGKQKYLFSMLDDETRFLIAQDVLDRKEGADARNLLQQSSKLTHRKPHVFVTDGLGSYHVAYLKEWWQRDRQKRTLHVRHIHLQRDMQNNKMERLNGEIRDREKVMRGLKKKDSVILRGYRMFHNFFREHSALGGMTPAEKCGIKINGENRWITVIQNAKQIQCQAKNHL